MAEVSAQQGFLGSVFAARLLSFAVTSEDSFVSTRIGKDEGTLDERTRRSLKLVVSEDDVALIEAAVGRVLPRVLNELGIRPFPVASYEIELVGHCDGGFYHRHIDTCTGSNRSRSGDRVVSCVYYFYAQPKRFSGGELRLYPLPTRVAPAPEPIDIAPEHDTLVAFSSWMPHEVMPVVCPTRKFEDSRFSINCWVYQQREPITAQDA